MRARLLQVRRVQARRRAAFTLVEIMVVVVIIGLLAVIVVPNVMGHYAHAIHEKVKVDLTVIDGALKHFAINNAGRYPDSLVPLVTPDTNGMSYLDMDAVPQDPWGVEYQYEAPSQGQPTPRVFTLGKDKQPGGLGDDMDIDSQMVRNRQF